MATGGMTEAVQTGVKQAILPEIFNLQPEKTPASMMIGFNKRPENNIITWQAEKYDQRPFGGIMEGAPVSDAEFQTQLRETITGCCQHLRDAWKVTELTNAKDIAGIGQGKEAARQERMSMLHLRFKIERLILSAQTAAKQTSTAPWLSWGMFGVLNAALNAASQFPYPAPIMPDPLQVYTGDLANWGEAQLRASMGFAFQQIKTEVNNVGIVGRILRHILDDLTAVVKQSSSTAQPRTIFRVQGNDRYLNKVVDIETSEGKITLVTSPYLLCDPVTGQDTQYTNLSGLFIIPAMWKRAPLVPPYAKDLPEDGSGPRGFTATFEGLEGFNPLGQFAIQTSTGTGLS
jgi:hypothetical protein